MFPRATSVLKNETRKHLPSALHSTLFVRTEIVAEPEGHELATQAEVLMINLQLSPPSLRLKVTEGQFLVT